MYQPITRKSCPEIMDALDQLYNDGDPIRTMLLLTDLKHLGIKEDIIPDNALPDLNRIQHLLGEIALQKRNDT